MNENIFKSVKEASLVLAKTTYIERQKALENIALLLDEYREEIKKENEKDILSSKEKGEKSSLLDRLHYTDEKIDQSILSLKNVKMLPDPIGRVREKRELDTSFVLSKITVPLGVIGFVFEARPDALLQIASLALMSGNGIILKGGSEANNTNRILTKIIKEATKESSFSSLWIELLETRDEVKELLTMDKYVDLIIPRGSNSFVRYVMDNTHIPVLGHANGLCITYVEESANFSEAIKILIDAKTQYPSACNATETILVDKAIVPSFIPLLDKAFKEHGVIVHADDVTFPFFSSAVKATKEDWDTEYLAKECAVKSVENISQAIEHIQKHSSHHTDCIITSSDEKAKLFVRSVDSADVFVNCSTRFADGYRFGLGAEVGISTSRLHARGPVGLDGLMTTKWVLVGHGECVSDYSSGGTKTFHFKEEKV